MQPNVIDVLVNAGRSSLRDELVSALRTGGVTCMVFDGDGDGALDFDPDGCSPSLALVGPPFVGGDLALPIKMLRQKLPGAGIVPFAPEPNPAAVAEAFRNGCLDFVVGKDASTVYKQVRRLIGRKPGASSQEFESEHGVRRFEGLMSRNTAMWAIFDMIEQLREADATVLIEGETGTGKELVAQAVQQRCHRSAGPFLAINCGAMTQTLLDSELFGHEKGSFTGASARSIGLFEKADGGTLFLDEISSISMEMQQRLLRVLETGQVRRVGGTDSHPTDVRIIAATNVELQKAMEQGTFRRDLYYRLNVIHMEIPPLRERPEDIPLLFDQFIHKFAHRYNLPAPKIGPGILDELMSHDWPGNVRELVNLAERLVVTSGGRDVTKDHFELGLVGSADTSTGWRQALPDLTRPLRENLDDLVASFERDYLHRLLARHQGRLKRCADHAQISRRTLYRKMQIYDLDKRSYRSGRAGRSQRRESALSNPFGPPMDESHPVGHEGGSRVADRESRNGNGGNGHRGRNGAGRHANRWEDVDRPPRRVRGSDRVIGL